MRILNGTKPFAVGAVLLLALAVAPAYAQDADRIKPDPPSAFVSKLGGRNPFWPVGWRPKNKASQPAKPTRPVITDISPEVASISSILLGNPPIAVVNGGEYVPGDEIPLVVNGSSIKVRLLAVGDGFIRLRYDGRDYIVRKQFR